MMEITNKNKGPIQIVVRSKRNPKAFTTLNIPGVGSGHNVKYLEDERYTDYIQRIEDMKLISVKRFTGKIGD